MDTFRSPVRLMLVCDVDKVVDIHDSENMSLLRFNSYWEAYGRGDAVLLYTTRKTKLDFMRWRKNIPIPNPDITIYSDGEEVYVGHSRSAETIDDEWMNKLLQKWNKDDIEKEANKFSELLLKADAEQQPHKVTYYVEKKAAQQVSKLLAEKLKERGLEVKIDYNGDHLDILPQESLKNLAITYVVEKWAPKISTKDMPLNILICCCSKNDTVLFNILDTKAKGVMAVADPGF